MGTMRQAALALAAGGILFAAVPAVGDPAAGGLRRDAVVRAVEAARPSVVNVNAEEDLVRANPFSRYGDSLFDRFFQDFFESAPRRPGRSRSLGSGVIIDPAGFILTNEHVVARASRISVTLADERTFDARIVGSDPDHDLAVLKVDAGGPLPSLGIGTSVDLMIGEKVIAIGNPFGLSHTVTTGVVSATRRSLRTGEGRVYYDFVQTDAAINPGNSGGPLLNIDGHLVGINTAIYAKGDGIGFAIPADVALRVVEDLVRFGEVKPVWLELAAGGLRRGEGSAEAGGGVAVLRLLSDGAGRKAGLKVGDVILKVGEERVKSAGEYHFRIGRYSAGDLIPLEVLRGRKTVDFIVRAETPDDGTVRRMAWEWLGLEAGEDRYGLGVKRVRRGSPAAGIGLRAGDRLLQVEGEEVSRDENLTHALFPALRKGSVLFLIQRNQYGYYVTLKIPEG